MLTKINDNLLLTRMKTLVQKERLTLEQILNHLQEIEKRKLYCDLGYGSLYQYLVKELKYSEGAAVRRINAIKLVKKVPAAKEMIASGELNLTTVNTIHNASKGQDKKTTAKLLDAAKGKSKTETQKTILELLPDSNSKTKRDSKTQITPSEIRAHFNLKNETLEKLERLKDLKKMNNDEAINYAVELALSVYEKSLDETRKSQGTKGRTIPAKVKKTVMKRSNACCEHPGCSESKFLEFHHEIPYAKGGKHTVDNIKLYCRNHNTRAAIKDFGQAQMQRYLN